MMVGQRPTGTELSVSIKAGDINRKPKRIELRASEAERSAVARRFDILQIDRFEASVALRRTPLGLIHLQGTLRAKVAQECVITLEPVEADIEEAFEAFYSEAPRDDENVESDMTLEDELWPEPVVEGRIDVGEAVIQQLGVALDPYPKKANAELHKSEFGTKTTDSHRPFAGLAELTPKQRGPDKAR